MLTIEDIRQALQEEDLKVLKSLGQNFLIDESVLGDIVAAAELGSEDTVIEVGPGLGTLTFALAPRCQRVIAIEKDRKMGKFLRRSLSEKLGEKNNVELLSADILHLNLPELLAERGVQHYKLVANIPYYITSPIIKLFLETAPQPEAMVMLVQKEVAERICASQGDLSILALSVLLYGRPTLVRPVASAAFYPAPKVDSAILRIDEISKRYTDAQYWQLFRLIKISFASKRKTLLNNLAAGLKLDKPVTAELLAAAGIAPAARAQDLGVPEWRQLVSELERGASGN
jgi:16S rRNA (adenine1518-N6/adenine1519-N6)-dimethyltransferase